MMQKSGLAVAALLITALPAHAAQWLNGDRTAMMTVTASPGTLLQTPSNLVDGATGSNASDGAAFTSAFFPDQSKYIKFTFTGPKIVQSVRWYQEFASSHGQWRWQGCDAQDICTNIGEPFTLGGATVQDQTSLSANGTEYQSYKLVGVGGGPVTHTIWLQEVDFLIADAPPPPPSGAPPAGAEIYLLMGQSNMSGRGLLGKLPTFLHASSVWVYTNAATWQNPAQEPVDSAAGQVDAISIDANAGASPSLAFGDRLTELRGQPIVLVPCALGGTPISWHRRDWRRTSLYGSCLARAREAAQNGTIKGVFWYQGESDAQESALAALYGHALSELIAAWRADLALPDLAWVVTVLGPAPSGGVFPYWSTVQAAISQMQGPGVGVVSASDLPAQAASSPHLTTAGYVTIGRRAADRMHSLLSE